jgi:hypothetical protein
VVCNIIHSWKQCYRKPQNWCNTTLPESFLQFLSIASRAADYEEIYSYVDNVLNTLHRDVDEKIKNSPNILANQSMEQEIIVIPEKYSHITSLKKKVVKKKTSRRRRTWFNKLHRATQRKRGKNVPKTTHMCSRDLGHLLPLLTY